jgi:hypothetical protein
MSQAIRVGPFEEFDLRGSFWSQPNRLLHLLRAQFFAESGAVPALGYAKVDPVVAR